MEFVPLMREQAQAQIAAAHTSFKAGRKVFTELNDAAADQLREHNMPGPLAGLTISVKDLFDVVGSVTRAGSVVLSNNPPATADAVAVKLVRSAGAILVGKTNMTEFAYSGLGLNPHYGTPSNPCFSDTPRLPGGSTSGGAVSVAIGAAWAALGTDTGGSLRIPAALCGLVGWKPTARRISREGAFPLSHSFDSVGPIARDVASIILLDGTLTGTAPPQPVPLAGIRFAVADRVVMDDMDAITANAYDNALRRLSSSGAILIQTTLTTLDRIVASGAGPLIVAREAYDIHRDYLAIARERYDPRVAARITLGSECDDKSYRAALQIRSTLIDDMSTELQGVDAWLMPTVPIDAPPLAQLTEDEAYFAMNKLLLRNPSLVNFLDGCAISLPLPERGGISIAGPTGSDAHILAIALAVEHLLSS